MKRIALVSGATAIALALGQTLALAQPSGPDDRHHKRPKAFSVSLAGECGGLVEVRWRWRATSGGRSYEAFEVLIDGRPWLTLDQEARARGALEALHRRGMSFAGGRFRCRSDAPIGTIELFQEPAMDARPQGRLLVVLDDRRQGLLFWPTAGPPVDALAFATR